LLLVVEAEFTPGRIWRGATSGGSGDGILPSVIDRPDAADAEVGLRNLAIIWLTG